MEIGEHCAFSSCKRLDFLPFTCLQCQKLFCKDHRFPDQHQCEHGQSQSPCLESHEPKDVLRAFGCSVDGCKRKEMMEVRCPYCDTPFCLQHRHQVDHNCPALPSDEKTQPSRPKPSHGHRAAAGKNAEEQTKSWSAAKVARLESTRNKVLLMKLKMKAEGSDSIPLTERVYYNVRLPPAPEYESAFRSEPMFFSKEWSVGKVVDIIASQNRIRNNNFDPRAEEKLVMCPVDGEALEPARLLKSLDCLPSGSDVQLKYIPKCKPERR